MLCIKCAGKWVAILGLLLAVLSTRRGVRDKVKALLAKRSKGGRSGGGAGGTSIYTAAAGGDSPGASTV